jgi:hypothetical protein
MKQTGRDGGESREWEELAAMRDSFLQGVKRSSTLLVGSQVQAFLKRYFSLSELLVVIFSIHVLLCLGPAKVQGFNASLDLLNNLIQTVVIQLGIEFVSGETRDGLGLINLLVLLMIAESVPVVKGWLGNDTSSLASRISFLFSDRVSAMLQEYGVPLAGVSLGFAFGGSGLFGQTMNLTGVNCLCAVTFGVIQGGELTLAWPVLLLFFVHEVSTHFNEVKTFLDYGLYKASDAVFSSLSVWGVSSYIMAIGFAFLTLILPQDPLWTGLCVLVLAQASSDWFLKEIEGISETDPVLAGLCIVTVVYFVNLGVALYSPIPG